MQEVPDRGHGVVVPLVDRHSLIEAQPCHEI